MKTPDFISFDPSQVTKKKILNLGWGFFVFPKFCVSLV